MKGKAVRKTAYIAISKLFANRKSSLTASEIASRTGFAVKTIQNELALGVPGVTVTGKKGRQNLYGKHTYTGFGSSI